VSGGRVRIGIEKSKLARIFASFISAGSGVMKPTEAEAAGAH
jgi:hypothetical protein